MHLFLIMTTFRERAKDWQARFPSLFLAAFLIIFLVIETAFGSVTDQAHANPIPTHPIQLSSVHMIDSQHGWAFDSNLKHVFATHRGAEHWVDVTPDFMIKNPGIVTSSFFLNATHGYIGFSPPYKTFLLSTQDGGQTWQATSFTINGTIPEEVGLIQIGFLDAQHGWLTFLRDQRSPGAFDYVMMSTTDGGKTWQTVFDTYQNPASLRLPYSTSLRLMFASPLNGWATGTWLSGDVYLYETHDGGQTWSKSNITPIKGTHDINTTQDYGPDWQNSQSGTLLVRYDTQDAVHITTYRTLDGGKSWILGPSASSTSFQETSNFSFPNAREAWSFGFDGQGQYVIHHTNNNGLTWNVFHPTGLIPAQADTQVLLSLTFISNTIGWLTIKDGQGINYLFQTNTGGHTWRALQPSTD